MNVGLLYARWVLGLLATEMVPDIATDALAQGRDGEALRRLAGMERPTRADIGGLFERALEEMGYQVESLGEEAAARAVVRDIARGIVSGEMDAAEGAEALWAMWEPCGEPLELGVFGCLSDDYEDCQGIPEQAQEIRQTIIAEAKELLVRWSGSSYPQQQE